MSTDKKKGEKYKGISLETKKTIDLLSEELVMQLADEAEKADRKFYSYMRWKLSQPVPFSR